MRKNTKRDASCSALCCPSSSSALPSASVLLFASHHYLHRARLAQEAESIARISVQLLREEAHKMQQAV